MFERLHVCTPTPAGGWRLATGDCYRYPHDVPWSTRFVRQEDLGIAWPTPEQPARRSGRKLGADIGFKLRTPVTEQLWGGERHQ